MHPLKIAHTAVAEHGALQKPAELAGFLALVMDLHPQVVVEIGSDVGGTLWAWQQLGARRVIGVDLPNAKFSSGCYAMRKSNDLEAHGSEVVYGDSHDTETLQRLVDLLGDDEIDLLFIDGDHTYDGVEQDFYMYGPLVRPGGIIGLHDICNHGRPDVQVDQWWRTLRVPKEEIITDPPTWGGIGVIHQPAVAA
jgi:predicted O-methyltransferase YrrM